MKISVISGKTGRADNNRSTFAQDSKSQAMSE